MALFDASKIVLKNEYDQQSVRLLKSIKPDFEQNGRCCSDRQTINSLSSSLSQPPSVPRDERSIVLALTCGCSLLRSIPRGKRWEMSWLHKREVGSAGANVSDVLLGECRKACVISPLGQPAQTSECGGPDRSIEYIKGGCGPDLGLPDAREALDPRAGPAECKLIYRNRFWRSKPSLTVEGKCGGGVIASLQTSLWADR